MNVNPHTGAVVMSKPEVRRVVEARTVIEMLARVTRDADEKDELEDIAGLLAQKAKQYGGEHVNAAGYLVESPREAAVNAGVPG